MSDNIPFDIQSEIIKRLPVKSVIQFRSVSKQWKSYIDNPEFIKNYHINHANPQHLLLVTYELDTVQTNTSIIDDNTFPQQKFPLTTPKYLSLMNFGRIISPVDGLLCIYGEVDSRTIMAVIWNPSVRKSVDIVIPHAKAGDVLGFGACQDTSDHKLVNISVYETSSSMSWVVQVFTLSTRVWKTVYTGAPIIACYFFNFQAFVDGVIYFSAYNFYRYSMISIVISFDLKSEEFGIVRLPKRLIYSPCLDVARVNDSLGLLEYFVEGEVRFCGVWMRKDGANKRFTKMYNIKVGLYGRVLGFRNNDEVVIELSDDNSEESSIEIYEPSSGHINGVGINGKRRGYFSVRSYTESLLLLDEPDSIIH